MQNLDVLYTRFDMLLNVMELELASGIYCGRNINPFEIAVNELGIKAELDDEGRITNKREIFETTLLLTPDDAINRMLAHENTAHIPEHQEATGDYTAKLFQVQYEFSQEKIIDLLISAFEGGSNYWYFITDTKKPSQPEMIPQQVKQYTYLSHCWGDGHIEIVDTDEYHNNDRSAKGLDKWYLTEEAINKGIKIFSEQHKKEFFKFLAESYDANTADIFLQCCLFGEVVYG